MATLPVVPTATVALNLTFPLPVLQDIDTYWRQQVQGIAGTLAANVGASDTTVTVTVNNGYQVPSAPFAFIVDTEPMLVTGVAGNVWTVTRGSSVSFISTGVTHTAGAVVTVLKFPSAWALWAQLIRGNVATMCQTLSQQNQSATYACTVTGTISQT